LVLGEDAVAMWSYLQKVVGKRYLVTVQPGPKGGKPSVQGVTLPPEI